MDLNEHLSSEENDNEPFFPEGSSKEEFIEGLNALFPEIAEEISFDLSPEMQNAPESFASFMEEDLSFFDSEGKVDHSKIQDFLETNLNGSTMEDLLEHITLGIPEAEGIFRELDDFLQSTEFQLEESEDAHPSFSEEFTLFAESSEEAMDFEKLEDFFKECAQSSHSEEKDVAEGGEALPFTLDQVRERVSLCESYFLKKFGVYSLENCKKVILPKDVPYLEPQEYGMLVDFLRNGWARVDFSRQPTDFMAGFFLYQSAFPELELDLPPRKKYPLYFESPTHFSMPGSTDYFLGMKYYDLGEIAFQQGDIIGFFSHALASSYYGYPLAKELIQRIFIGIRLKNLTEDTHSVATSKKSLLLAGHVHLTGIGGIYNEEQAFLCYKKLALEKNSASGKLALAMCFLDGIWAKEDKEVAINLLKDAAEMGNGTAIYQLILAYIMDETSPSLLGEAVELCKHPKIQGQPFSSFLLGLFYTYGIGVEADLDRGLYFSSQAGDFEIQTLGNKLRTRLMLLLEE